jgi:hypothetical protein
MFVAHPGKCSFRGSCGSRCDNPQATFDYSILGNIQVDYISHLDSGTVLLICY